jgi:hypothetical protein
MILSSRDQISLLGESGFRKSAKGIKHEVNYDRGVYYLENSF